jgi:hypothetical protein
LEPERQDAANEFWYIATMKLTAPWNAARPLRIFLCLAGFLAFAACGQAVAKEGQICGFDQPFQYSFLSWKDKVKVEQGRAVLHGLETKGGSGVTAAMNLAARGTK